MTQNEAVIFDYIRDIRATLAEIAEDMGAAKTSIASIERHMAACLRERVPFVQDSPNIGS